MHLPLSHDVIIKCAAASPPLEHGERDEKHTTRHESSRVELKEQKQSSEEH